MKHEPIAVVCFMVACVIISGCKRIPFSTPAQEAAGRARGFRDNELRKTAGLREIGPAWICFRSINGQDEWIIDRNSRCADKWVVYDEERTKILKETDRWLSGRKFKCDDPDHGMIDEELGYTFDYVARKFSFFCLSDDDDLEGIRRNSLSESAAFKVVDSVLKKWGKSRL